MSFSNEEYADMHLVYGEVNGNGSAARRLYAERYPERRLPNRLTFIDIDRRLRERGTFSARRIDQGRQQLRRNHLEEDIMNLLRLHPTISIRRISARLDVPSTTVWRIIHENHHHPYHFQHVQALEEGDPAIRLNFCRWLRQENMNNILLVSRILFTDEATFTRDGIFNYHNLHVWSQENPHAVLQVRHQRGFKINVWCGIIGNYLIGPYDLPNLNGERYLNFLRTEVEDALDEVIPLAVRRAMWFMHDGAPPHFSLQVREFLGQEYNERWIGRGGPIAWPPRSPDLNPLDFFLWGYLKNRVYSTELNSREDLWHRIVSSCRELQNNSDLFIRIRQNLVRRLHTCIEENGNHFEHLL